MKRSWTALIAAAASAVLAACGPSETAESSNEAAGPEAPSGNAAAANQTAPGPPGPAQSNAVPPAPGPPPGSAPPPLGAPPPAAPPPPPAGPDQPQPALEHEYINQTGHADHPPAKDDPMR